MMINYPVVPRVAGCKPAELLKTCDKHVLTNSTLDIYQDNLNICSLHSALNLADLKNIAVENAINSHPVTESIKNGKKQSSFMYPAISESYVKFIDYKKEILTGKKVKPKKKIRKANIVYDGKAETPFIAWSLPMQEKSKTCGVIHTDHNDIKFKGCSRDPLDYSVAFVNHCWRLNCEFCGNATALKMGINSEQKIIAPIDIIERKTGDIEKFKHWVISPPQSWIKRIMQRADTYADFYDDLTELIQIYGLNNGCIVFHPWRWNTENQEWIISPHFHIIATGFFHNEKFRTDLKRISDISKKHGSGTWIIKQIHPNEKIKSVRHTIAYLLTHCGIGTFTHSVNWNDETEDLLHPIIKKGINEYYKTISTTEYNADWKESGLYTEHLDQVDFEEWAIKSVTAKFTSIRYFGLCNKTRILGTYGEKATALCPVCGSPMGLYSCLHDKEPEILEYQKLSTVRVMSEDIEKVKNKLEKDKEKLKSEGMTLLNFALSVPHCSTPESMNVQKYESKTTVEERKKLYETAKLQTIVYDIRPYEENIPIYEYKPKIILKTELNEFLEKQRLLKMSVGILSSINKKD